jgi:hypothetical protein
MSQRKKIKVEKEEERLQELLNKVKLEPTRENAVKDGVVLIELKKEIKNLIKNLKVQKYRIISLKILFEIFKWKIDLNLDDSQVLMIFEILLEILKNEFFDCTDLVASNIPQLLKDDDLIEKYFEFYLKCNLNKENLKDLLIIFIEKSDKKDQYVNSILEKYEKYKDFIPRIAKLIDFDKISEDLYIKIFLDFQYIRESIDLRIIKGKKRFSYISQVSTFNLDFVFKNYIKDRDKIIRIFLAKLTTPKYELYFDILLNDPDEDVRFALIEKFSWEDCYSTNLPDRLLDKSNKIRQRVYEIYRSGLYHLRSLSICKIFDDKTASINQSVTDGKLGFSNGLPLSHTEDPADCVQFEAFIKKISEGCLTGYSEEYINLLIESRFSLKFLAEHEDLSGFSTFLKSYEIIIDLNTLPNDLKAFALRHFFKGKLNFSQILDLINLNVFEVLNFIPTEMNFNEILLEKAKSISNLEDVEKIAEFLNEKIVLNEEGPFIFPNFYFLLAHANVKTEFNLNLNEQSEYPSLYYQVFKKDPNFIFNLKNSKISIDQKIKLLICFNTPEILADFANDIICCKFACKTRDLILKRKNLNSTLIYFLCTGLVSISNTSFFIRSIKSCLKLKNDEKMKIIFEKYVKAVPERTFELFCSICSILKGCTVSGKFNQSINDRMIKKHKSEQETKQEIQGEMSMIDCDGSLIINPLLSQSIDVTPKKFAEIKFNENLPENTSNTEKPASISEDKLKIEDGKLFLSLEDKNLHSICNFIVSLGPEKVRDLDLDIEKLGFFKMSDLMCEMIGHGQIVYQ